MRFEELALCFEQIENVSSRLEMTRLLSEIFKKLSDAEIVCVSYMLQGRIAPMYEKKEFILGERMVIKTIIKALHIDRSLFEKKFHELGDIGKTTEYYRAITHSFFEKSLTILEVYEKLKLVVAAEGSGSQEIKLSLLGELITMLDKKSARYVVRIPLGQLRLGLSDMTILDALSWMESGGKTLRPKIEKAYLVKPDIGFIAYVVKTKGVRGLNTIKPELFTPIIMMKAERLSSGKEICEKVHMGIMEPKYDGFRLQAHMRKTGRNVEVQLYSRGLDNVSYMYPDIVDGIKKSIKAQNCIIEGEAVGFNEQTGEYLPFQETVTRKRKYNIFEKSREVPLKFFVFELLYKNGKSLLDLPFISRRKQLKSSIKNESVRIKSDILIFPQETIAQTAHDIELFFHDSISRGLEGVMIKKQDGIYQPGARGWNWIKYKRSYSKGINDTIDCVVMGYDYGKGKRTVFGIGAFLVGIYDEKEDRFKSIAKIGTGLTDDNWKLLQKQCLKYVVNKIPILYEIDPQMYCDVWITPAIVVEIKADEITRSPSHTAGRSMKKSKSGSSEIVDIPGYALRFPRLERFRDDKYPTDATTLSEIQSLFKENRKKKY